jgi:uncharacterized protein
MNRRDSIKLFTAAAASAFLSPRLALALPSASGDGKFADTATFKSEPIFTWLPVGAVKPAGWIKAQMVRDLNEGFAGCLGKLCHEASSDIFVTNRNSIHAKNTTNSFGSAWWNGESEGNWRAGFIMMSYLTSDSETMREADEYVRHILSSQDSDGYLGIFASDSRWIHPGELWTQACLLRGLLDYADLAGNAAVQTAVQRCADLIISVYGSDRTPVPWGEDHDLMIVDVMERLFERTGEPRYRDFSVEFYDAWSRNVSTADTSIPSLLNREAPFVQHGVHVYETIRVPLWLASATGREDLGQASRNAIEKLCRYVEPSGSAVSQEMISKLAPNPTTTEYEYCASKEIQLTLESALQKTGIAEYGDMVEKVWFNAAQGARTPDGRAITYLTPDNRIRCDGLTPDQTRSDPRNKFSPTHADAAVCCNPNATNVAGLFVRGMWMRRGNDTLAALLYGPCRVSTEIAGAAVELEEQTAYPFDNTVTITVRPQRKTEFSILLREPEWSRNTAVRCDNARVAREGSYWRVTKTWAPGDVIHVEFDREIRQFTAVNGEVALEYGALIFARRIPSTSTVIRTYPVSGFSDTYDEPTAGKQEELIFPAGAEWQAFGFQPQETKPAATVEYPFDEPVVVLRGSMIRHYDHQPVEVELVPLGNAPVLRRTTHAVST